MEYNYRKTEYLNQVVLNKEEFIKLIELLMESGNNEEKEIELTIIKNNMDIILTSIDELSNCYEKITDINIQISFYDKKKKISPHYIRMKLRSKFAKYYLSSNNQVWFLGKIEQINKYLKKFKPWYSLFRFINPFILGVMCSIIITDLFKIIAHNLYYLTIYLFLILVQSINVYLFFKHLPYTQIYMREKKKIFTTENIKVLMSVLTFVCTLITLIFAIIKNE